MYRAPTILAKKVSAELGDSLFLLLCLFVALNIVAILVAIVTPLRGTAWGGLVGIGAILGR